MNYNYAPERWLIIKSTKGYKVFGTWRGGYLDGDSWRLNSGVTKVEFKDDYYYIHGYSGSVYACHKESYGTTAYGSSVLTRMEELNEGMITLETMPDMLNLIKEKTDDIL